MAIKHVIEDATSTGVIGGHTGFFNVGKLTGSERGGITQRFDHDAAGRIVESRWTGIDAKQAELENQSPVNYLQRADEIG